MNQFGLAHYVPILRWKQAERTALSRLYEDDSKNVTPLIEVVPENFVRKVPKAPTVTLSMDDVINKMGWQISKCWGERPFYIDLSLISAETLYQGHNHFLTLLSQYASTLRLSLIPVVGIRKDGEYLSAVLDAIRIHNQGACLRLTEEDIKRSTLPKEISTLLSVLKTAPESVDLMVDFKNAQQNIPKFDGLCKILPNIDKWRNYIVAGGAFPEDLSGLKKNDIHRLPREEWTWWREQAINKQTARRFPLYSDYTIQYPKYRDRKGPMNYSASIRYTSENDWVIMRGESVFAEDGPGAGQWPANAALLCQQQEYCGNNFSYGDGYIKEKSAAYDKPGSATTWLGAGINHHMTFVVRQLAMLFAVSAAALS